MTKTHLRVDEAAAACGLTQKQLLAILQEPAAVTRPPLHLSTTSDQYVSLDGLLAALGEAASTGAPVRERDESDRVPRHLLTIDEAAAACALSRTKFNELVRSGEVESCLVGRARRIPVGALDDFVARLRAAGE